MGGVLLVWLFVEIHQEFLDFVASQGVEISKQCIFHSNNDLFQPILDSFRMKRSRFRCKKCNENFHTKPQLYEHIISEHPNVFADHVSLQTNLLIRKCISNNLSDRGCLPTRFLRYLIMPFFIGRLNARERKFFM